MKLIKVTGSIVNTAIVTDDWDVYSKARNIRKAHKYEGCSVIKARVSNSRDLVNIIKITYPEYKWVIK